MQHQRFQDYLVIFQVNHLLCECSLSAVYLL